MEKNISKEKNINENSLNNNDLSDKKDNFDNSIETKIDLNNNDFSDKKIQNEDKDNSIDKRSEMVDDSISNNNEYNGFGVPKILNLSEIMAIRINNTMATADKNLLKLEMNNFELLKDFSFDQEIGYLVNELLDSHLRAVGSENLIISYGSQAIVEQNLINIIRLNEVYNKITNSNKNIAIISDEEWDKLKNEYISNLKNNIKYEIKEEPDVILEEIKNDDIISSSAISLFGEDIVEIE